MTPSARLSVILGVSGGIAAYKAVHLLRLLSEAGHDVRVVPTRSALQFVGAATWEALAGHPVHTDVFSGAAEIEHVRLGRRADLVIVAPATADLLARAAHGRADDLLTATLLTATCPVLLAPAMHTEMWLHAATQANVATLRGRGVTVLDPDDGRLAGVDTGPGRLPEPEAIADSALALVAPKDLAGVRAVVSAGGTREALDPVRFLGNRSSGRQGVAVAEALARRGADVTLVAANLEVPAPAGVAVVPVTSALELREAVLAAATDADAVVMAAAVADFRPSHPVASKIKKVDAHSAPTIELVQNPDILAELVSRRRDDQLIVGFAAETGDGEADALERGRQKALRKGADLLAVNAVGPSLGFGDVPNAVVVLGPQGEEIVRAAGSKVDVAATLVTLLASRLQRAG